MGVAFAAVVTSLTSDIVNPLVARIFTVDNLADWAPAGVRIGAFLVALLNFLIVGFVMFLVVKTYNRMRSTAPPAEPTEEVILLTEIRDELKARR
jgi:large conductance mechanosensitive channel